MDPAAPAARSMVSKIVAAAGKDRLRVYIQQSSTAEIRRNATCFPHHQYLPASTPSSHAVPIPSTIFSPSGNVFFIAPTNFSPNNTRNASSTLRSSSPIAAADSDEEEMPAVPLLPPPKRKRVQSAGVLKVDSASDSDCVVVTDRKKGKRRKKETTSGSGKEMHEITKQFRIPEIRDITELPHSGSWTIPRTEDGEDFAYRLDMTADP
ncbi:hypothetical protein FB451DRAFT_1391416 [Mycena latifolia]|nr:hypothetical protein FB451DRAFT_1391416 [Mycena latifolia]